MKTIDARPTQGHSNRRLLGALLSSIIFLLGMIGNAAAWSMPNNVPRAATSVASPSAQPATTGEWNLPYFGFNAKGTLDTNQQVNYATAYFEQIPRSITPNLVIRVTGGTASQTTYRQDWTDDIIAAWVSLQQTYDLRFIYVVNGNDTPANQRDIVQRWLDAGARFDLLEMMNEYYLPKFANGNTDRPEVTRQVTAEAYVDQILPAFWTELDRFGLPYYLIFAPARPDSMPQAQEKMEHWNAVVADAIRNDYRERNLHATLHLYTTGDLDEFDYGQIDRLRATLPPGRHIAITESGIIDKSLDYQQAGLAEVAFLQNILRHLVPGDYLLDQVLYNASRNNNTAILNPHIGGTTPKGEIMLPFIANQLC